MAKDVCCNVESCYFNENEKCSAHEIKVSNCHCKKANTSPETECDTFKLK